MSTSTDRAPASEQAAAGREPGDGEDAGSTGLFPGDTGTLAEPTRRALLQLLRGPYIHRDLHPRLWPVVVRDEEVLRSRLSDLFLALVLDTERGVAFIRNAAAPEADSIPKVTRATPLSLIDTGLVLLLREHLLQAETLSTRAFIDREEIDDALSVYRPATSTDQAMFERRVAGSVERFKSNSVLLRTAETDRYEISPVLALIFDADQVGRVRTAIDRMIDGSPESPGADGGDGAPVDGSDDEEEI